jgi:hypothetical protein
MDVPMFVWGIFFLCILFWVFVFTNRKQILIRMQRKIVAVNLYEFKKIRRMYEDAITNKHPVDALIKRIQLFQSNIQKTIENATVVISLDPAFKDKKTNKTYVNAVNKSNERLERICTLAKNFEHFISERHTAQQK